MGTYLSKEVIEMFRPDVETVIQKKEICKEIKQKNKPCYIEKPYQYTDETNGCGYALMAKYDIPVSSR